LLEALDEHKTPALHVRGLFQTVFS
jgi:hypothetical protein